jgi:hypothetical protein
MMSVDVRAFLNEEWARIDREAEARKDSHSAVFELARLYRGLADDQREAADEVLVEWLLSEDPRKRFDALALVDEFSVSAAIVALRALETRFRQSGEPSSPYDVAKIVRILQRLGSAESGRRN